MVHDFVKKGWYMIILKPTMEIENDFTHVYYHFWSN